MGDFDCCAGMSDSAVLAAHAETVQRAEAERVARWIAPGTLERFPCGPYAVHAYFPATRRELVTRNLLPADAASQADAHAEAGRDVHVSLDTCG